MPNDKDDFQEPILRRLQEGQQIQTRTQQPVKSLLGNESTTNPVPQENTVLFTPPVSVTPSADSSTTASNETSGGQTTGGSGDSEQGG